MIGSKYPLVIKLPSASSRSRWRAGVCFLGGMMTNIEDWIKEQNNAENEIRSLARKIAIAAPPIWMWGDGNGGYIYQIIIQELKNAGLISRITREDLSRQTDKGTRARLLHREILERDAYRCQNCGGWHDLQIDHIFPRSKGGTDDPENLQVLCATCNGEKGAKIP